jgi:hypothetical protein
MMVSAIMPYPESTLSGIIEVLRPSSRQTVEEYCAPTGCSSAYKPDEHHCDSACLLVARMNKISKIRRF